MLATADSDTALWPPILYRHRSTEDFLEECEPIRAAIKIAQITLHDY